jgi:uncharacterized protein YbjT (DUF2867 family)
MKDKIITIFGATGFVGKYVCNELIKAGYTLRVVSRSFERAKLLRTGALVGQVVPVAGDINRPDDFAKLVEGSYAVVNLVGILYESGRQKFNNIHNVNAGKLAEAAKKAGARTFIHISANVAEGSKAKYAQSKLAGEKAVQSAFPEAFILKPSVIFGAEDNFTNKFARMGVISPLLPLIGGGRTKFQPVYVGDVAKAVFAAIDSENIKSGTYLLAGPQTLTFREILSFLDEHTGREHGFISIPFGLAKLMATFSPAFVLTRDQVEMLKADNVTNTRSRGLKELGINPTGMEAVAPEYLARYARISHAEKARHSV